MLPWSIEIVPVANAGAQAKPKLRERNIRCPGGQFPRPKPSGPERKLERVDALPAHRHLKNTVRLPQRHAGRHLNPPPDHGADAKQPDLELQELRSL
jgi:hypothetical protein